MASKQISIIVTLKTVQVIALTRLAFNDLDIVLENGESISIPPERAKKLISIGLVRLSEEPVTEQTASEEK